MLISEAGPNGRYDKLFISVVVIPLFVVETPEIFPILFRV